MRRTRAELLKLLKTAQGLCASASKLSDTSIRSLHVRDSADKLFDEIASVFTAERQPCSRCLQKPESCSCIGGPQ